MPKVTIRAPKGCAQRDGTRKSANVVVQYTGPSSPLITKESSSKNHATTADTKEKCESPELDNDE